MRPSRWRGAPTSRALYRQPGTGTRCAWAPSTAADLHDGIGHAPGPCRSEGCTVHHLTNAWESVIGRITGTSSPGAMRRGGGSGVDLPRERRRAAPPSTSGCLAMVVHRRAPAAPRGAQLEPKAHSPLSSPGRSGKTERRAERL